MSSKRKASVSLFDIVQNVGAIAGYTHGMDKATFKSSRITIDAVERCIERVCEATVQLGTEAEALMPGHPWQRIRGLGNQLRHVYRSIDIDLVWDTAQNQIPLLGQSAQAALDRLNESQAAPEEPAATRKRP